MKLKQQQRTIAEWMGRDLGCDFLNDLDMPSKGLRMDIVLDSINKKGLWEKPLAKSQEGE